MSGLLFIVAAPSGAGKTTLVHRLLAQKPDIALSISCTTRAPRPNEVDGRDYHFLDAARFQRMIEAGDFLEWAQVHGNFYGTSRRFIEDARDTGRDVLLEIDWQGAAQVRKVFPDAIGVFILPPSLDALAARLHDRASDSADVIARRLAAAREEMRHAGDFSYVIINDDLDAALAQFVSIVEAARLEFLNQKKRHPDLFHHLISA
ncbi:MAG: guanylate kinase [Zoogloeaceae bacterium]|jgi:guanylate kinase|nr:guanylate kinase [Zoogloeaceae bacterium]